MHRSRLRALILTSTVVAAFSLTATSASAGDFPVPTFQEFAASTFQDEDSVYVANGDEPAYNVGHLL